MEPRAEEARQSSPASTPMPSVGDARLALAIHGKDQGFRTITVTFDNPDAEAAWGNLMRDGGFAHAFKNSTGASYEMVS